jgi:endonuclease-8
MEGPSLVVVSNALQIFIGQEILKAGGNAKFEKDVLVHQTIKEIYTFGKRLIIQLDTHALITHFLMYGSYRIDESRATLAPRLMLKTKKRTLYLYSCAIRCIRAHDLKPEIPFEFDIISPRWDIKKVVAKVKKFPTRTIDDILLDQEIFPGVGNIIKNEALFMSKLLPTRKVSSLSAQKLTELALNTREFSLHFVTWRQEYQLKKHLLIYRKKNCPTCGRPVLRKKTGKRDRWSFYCPVCQK